MNNNLNIDRECLQFKLKMLIRKINNINGDRIRIGSLGVDPHGKMVCLYEHQRSQFILVEIASIYKHFEHYRIDYIVDRCYDIKHRLPHALIFQSEQILQAFPTVQFSQNIEESQFVVIYFCTFMEIIMLSLGKVEIIFRLLYKLSSQILELTIINENVYISMYDGSMINVNLRGIQKKKKADVCRKIGFINESMKREQIGMSQSLRLDENRIENYKIWQTFSGKLMLNKKVLSNEFEDNFDYENSFEEYLGKQLNERHPMKYQMSRCRQYIIGASLGKIISASNIYILRASWCDWAQICQLSLKPQINQFWTSYQQWMREDQNWGFPMAKKNGNQLSSRKTDKVLIAYYCSAQTSLVISWIIVDKTMRKKINNHHTGRFGKEQVVEAIKYKSNQKVIIRVTNLKSPISDLIWIGLNQLLFIDKEFNLSFVEFDSNILRN